MRSWIGRGITSVKRRRDWIGCSRLASGRHFGDAERLVTGWAGHSKFRHFVSGFHVLFTPRACKFHILLSR